MFRESGVSKRFRLAGVSDSGIPDPAQTSMPRTALSDILPTARQVQARQDLLTSTLEPAESKTDTVLSPSTGSNEPTRTSPSLQTANTPIPLAATVGLVMPNPWSELYAGVNYSFGFVDAVQRPAPTLGGWLRHVQPLLVFPNSTVMSTKWQESPEQEGAIPEGSETLCGATAENWVKTYPFMFQQEGWHMFVVNQTWIQPSVVSLECAMLFWDSYSITVNNTCQLPLLAQRSFFSWQTLSIRPRPNQTPGPPDPTAAYTVFAEVTTQTPPSVPRDKHSASSGEKLAIGLGITAAIIGLIVIGIVIWWIRRKHKMERETLAFSRLSAEDQAIFLAENPEHFLNPNRPSKIAMRDRTVPPPGTMAYTQWYWDQMRQRQYDRWRWGQHAAQPGYNTPGWLGPTGREGYRGAPVMTQYGGYQSGYGTGVAQPAVVYNTR